MKSNKKIIILAFIFIFISSFTACDYYIEKLLSTKNLTIIIDPEGSGEVETDKESLVQGDEVTLTATPNNGFLFDHWSVDGLQDIITDNPFSIIMD